MIHATLLVAALGLFSTPSATVDDPFEEDVRFALEELESKCGHFFKLKGIDWKRVSKTFKKEAKDVETPKQHLRLLWRLLARLEDGHAEVVRLDKGRDIVMDGLEQGEWVAAGFHVCQVGKKYHIKTAFGEAAEVGVTAGMEIVSIDKEKPVKWFEAKVAELSDLQSFSTAHHALFNAFHWGLRNRPGERIKLELKEIGGKKRKRTISYGKDRNYHHGPAVTPTGLQRVNSLYWGKLPSGYGYVHVRWCKSSLPEDMDAALAGLGEVPGIVLDFRGNSGGGFDHDALFGRFIPSGETFGTGKTYASRGSDPYSGPVVVIVDATVRSSGETGSGMFKEDGRAYMIGDSPTAGMSSQKTTIELPSGYFGLYVSIGSNKQRFQDGRGIEGIGIEPHELVEYDPEELAAGIDTQIRRAEELLAERSWKAVAYDPSKFE